MDCSSVTVFVSNVPADADAEELFEFFESAVGSVFACKIPTYRNGWKPRGSCYVQLESPHAAQKACSLSSQGRLGLFRRSRLTAVPSSYKDIVARAVDPPNRGLGSVLRVGIMAEERQMRVLDSWENVRFEVMPERKKLELFLGESGERYKLEIMFGDIDVTCNCRLDGGGSNAVLLQMKCAPRIYHGIRGRTTNSKLVTFRSHPCKEDFQCRWVRATDFSSKSSIGKSTHLCLELTEGSPAFKSLRSLAISGKTEDLTLAKGELLCSSSKLVPIISCSCDYSIPYEVLFQINSLIHMQKISCVHVNGDLFGILSQLSLDTAIKILRKMHQLKSTCYSPVKFIQSQLANVKGNLKTISDKKSVDAVNSMRCHRVLVTPTKVYFLGPELEKTNYVVKHFSVYASNFLRVSFIEEDQNKLPSTTLTTRIDQGVFSKSFRTGLYDRILSILRDGILIGSKKFDFLAFSASQLRSNSVWMFASDGSTTADSIREWMGHFKKINSVSKCAARMGQQFSSSLQTLNVLPKDVKIIPDAEVIADGVKYCFSDGIGKISLSFARQIARKCGLDHTPSAFQIRYGGYKGVIAIDRGSFHKISLRPSMLKFDSNNTMLNVTSWSEHLPCFLNREIICLLSTLGIEDEVFESIQRDHLCLLDRMMTNREVALTVLDRMTGAEIRIAVKMLIQGYEPSSEPYLSMMLKAYREYQLSDLRSRCRVFVPKGRVLIGCLDETGSLNYGQVYVRVTMRREESDNDHSFFQKFDAATAVVVGKVMVTKNPCLHPGDIRVLQAVYDPQFNDMGLVDCVVFPQKGRRPHPSECSGGDLDGDLYFICWDEKLVPPKTEIPMDYIARRPRLMDHEVTLEEIQKFFVDYMISDTLGIISTAHLVHADHNPDKARSRECLQLASLHSMAVDFAKTGAPAEMPKVLRPKEFPDFMERWDRPMYASTGVFGKLYRATSGDNTGSSESSESTEYFFYDNDLEVKGFEEFLEASKGYYEQYAEKLSSLMNYYGVEYEDEILTGNLRVRPMHLLRDKRRYAEVKDRILLAVKSLHAEVEGWFKCSCTENEAARMASAWYHVTYHLMYRRNPRFLSFPWIVSDVLINIKDSKIQRM